MGAATLGVDFFLCSNGVLAWFLRCFISTSLVRFAALAVGRVVCRVCSSVQRAANRVGVAICGVKLLVLDTGKQGTELTACAYSGPAGSWWAVAGNITHRGSLWLAVVRCGSLWRDLGQGGRAALRESS